VKQCRRAEQRCRQSTEKKVIGIDSGRRRRRVSLNKNSKDAQCTGGEKDWFQLLLEIERRFRAEERKNLRAKCEIAPKPKNHLWGPGKFDAELFLV
jgi:hypothetical protein